MARKRTAVPNRIPTPHATPRARLVERRSVLMMGIAGSLSSGCRRRSGRGGSREASLWFTYGGRNRKVLEQLVDRFNESQSAFFLRAVYQGDYFEGLAKLRTALAAGVAPALSHVVGEIVPYLAEAGVLQAFDTYPGARDLDVIPALGQKGTWIGGADHPLVTLPFNRSTPIAYLNAELFEAEGLEAPRTWGELRSIARTLTRRSGSRTTRYGFGCPIAWWFWVALVGQAGGNVIERDGTVSLGGEAGVRALELWKDLTGDAKVMKPPAGRDYNAWEQTNQDFLAGRTAMIWTSTAFLRYLEDNARFPVRAAALPRDVRHAVPTGGTHWVIPKSAPDEEKEVAWAFLRFMHEPEQVIHWSTNTGYMPVTHEAVSHLEARGYYERHPNDRTSYDQLAVAMPWPWSPELFRIQREVVQPRLERAVLSRASAREVLDDARRWAGSEGARAR